MLIEFFLQNIYKFEKVLETCCALPKVSLKNPNDWLKKNVQYMIYYKLKRLKHKKYSPEKQYSLILIATKNYLELEPYYSAKMI